MIRVGVFSLILVAVAFAADSASPQGGPDDSKIAQALQLNAEELKLAAQGEEYSGNQLAYESALGLSIARFACKSLIVDPSEIKFTLYSTPFYKFTWNGSQKLNFSTYFDPTLPTQILISGRIQSEEVFQPAELAYTYAVRERRMNLITVNWDSYTLCSYAISPYWIVPQVANVVSDMIKNTLVAQNNMDYDKLRMTGFGFGAHMAGYTAKLLPKKPARITALDPAGLLYNIVPKFFKLQKGDAKFVDTIMTNRGLLGMTELVGDINFLPSGGRMQKACENYGVIGKELCSHRIAIEYYIESVQKGVAGFVGKGADSWSNFLNKNSKVFSEIMGEEVSQKSFGNYYLEVNAQAPYSRGINGAYLFKPVSEEPYEKNMDSSLRGE